MNVCKTRCPSIIQYVIFQSGQTGGRTIIPGEEDVRINYNLGGSLVLYMSIVRRFYPKRLTYINYLQFVEKGLAQRHIDMLTAVGMEPVLP